jgi:uncharacterized repeat protein (TIGR03843 family)
VGESSDGFPVRAAVGDARARELLRDGEMEVLGRMPWSSNGTYLVSLHGDTDELLAIYKPRAHERPLWDFHAGTLCQREVAACVVSDALGWEIVPDTVLRDGDAGVGSVQRFIPHDPEQHYFTLRDDRPEVFRRFALFDIVVNNTDRKGGHCLLDEHGHVWGIDHGVTFHQHFKLRTVIWDHEGTPIAAGELDALRKLNRTLDERNGAVLCDLLRPEEIAAVHARIDDLLEMGHFPTHDGEYYNYPWPMV